jgi:PPM family protein phosphatase
MSRLPSDETEQIPISGYSAAGLTASAQSMKVEFGASSHVGKVRAKNQDHFSIVRIARSLDVVSSNISSFEIPEKVEEFAYGMVVADGMGGMAGGERASILAIQTGIYLTRP